MTTSRSRSSTLLEPPPHGVELEDPGANDSASDSEMDHFSDASEGRGSTERPRTRTPSPVPRTRVEKVDGSPRYGEVPGSLAYQRRLSDAVPDEVEVVGDGSIPKGKESQSVRNSLCASPVPRTVVEKIDPSEASYGETPGTPAYEARMADAAPDSIVKVGEAIVPTPPELVLPGPVPETLLSRVETPPDRPGSATAHRRSPSDALPDAEEVVPDAPGSPPSTSRSDAGAGTRPQETDEMNNEDDDQFGDDFDTFEAGDKHAENDDFGDFGDAFEEPTSGAAMEESSQEQHTISFEQTSLPSFPPLINFDTLNSLSDLITSTTEQLDTLFPKASEASSLPPPEPVTNSSIFTTDRSLSLWSQLVAPPPLQPPNWIKSRIRRLFLVSLGVPVDLDEILPASKQKKLVLPSINLETTTTAPNSTSDSKSKDPKSSSNPQSLDPNRTSTSSSRRSTSRTRSSHRRRRHPSPPHLDLTAVHRLCATTDAALDGFTDEELAAHVKTLENMAARASEVLEYWLKRRDEQIGEKEAFEGVIENLVKHARQVRK